FQGWLKNLDVVPTVVSLREKIKTLAERERDKAFQEKLRNLPEADKRSVEALVNAIINKILHEPTTQLRRGGEDGSAPPPAPAARTARPRASPRRRGCSSTSPRRRCSGTPPPGSPIPPPRRRARRPPRYAPRDSGARSTSRRAPRSPGP